MQTRLRILIFILRAEGSDHRFKHRSDRAAGAHCEHDRWKGPQVETGKPVITAVPNLFGTRDRFRGRQFFHGWRFRR